MPQYSQDSVSAAIKLWNANVPKRQIEEQVGLSRAQLSRLARDHGLVPRTFVFSKKPKVDARIRIERDRKRALVIDMRAKGFTRAEIGSRLGLTKNAISGIVERIKAEGKTAAVCAERRKEIARIGAATRWSTDAIQFDADAIRAASLKFARDFVRHITNATQTGRISESASRRG